VLALEFFYSFTDGLRLVYRLSRSKLLNPFAARPPHWSGLSPKGYPNAK